MRTDALWPPGVGGGKETFNRLILHFTFCGTLDTKFFFLCHIHL